jgi:low affinity Fe/Cu permease
MTKLTIKALVFVMMIIIFGVFQYGGINTPPPFKDSWQSTLAGLGVAISLLLMVHEIGVVITTKKD